MTVRSGYADIQGQSADALVEAHADLVKRIAAHLMGRLPATVEMDDLVQVGLMALLAAARQYSPDKGANFATYAGIRVRGAMLDEVRAMDWTPRSVHRNQRRLTEAMRYSLLGGAGVPELGVAAEGTTRGLGGGLLLGGHWRKYDDYSSPDGVVDNAEHIATTG